MKEFMYIISLNYKDARRGITYNRTEYGAMPVGNKLNDLQRQIYQNAENRMSADIGITFRGGDKPAISHFTLMPNDLVVERTEYMYLLGAEYVGPNQRETFCREQHGPIIMGPNDTPLEAFNRILKETTEKLASTFGITIYQNQSPRISCFLLMPNDPL